MSSQTPRAGGRRMPRVEEPDDSYPNIPEPKQSHTGNLLAFVSVMAVLGFGFWTALGTLVGMGDKPAPTPTKAVVAATVVATTVPTAPPTVAIVATSLPAVTATPTGPKVHVVGAGDSLYKIAQRYGTTVDAIMAANGFTDRSKVLHVGDKINIP